MKILPVFLPMFLLMFLLLFPAMASANGLYQCARNGQSSYQDSPCDPASRQTQRQTQRQAGGVSSMPGCYVAEFPGYDGADGSSERFAIRAMPGSGYEMQFQGADRQSLPMKRATAEELRAVSKGFHVRVSDGVSLRWQPGTPNQKPVGVYRGQGADGKRLILAFFFLSNALATEVACR